ncbi:Uncharacterised protein [Bordetella pertussis]|nr:Uncharacterised protein [Bordetella pertussis]
MPRICVRASVPAAKASSRSRRAPAARWTRWRS